MVNRNYWIHQFNNWRKNYEHMSLEDQVNFHNIIEKTFPKQQHFVVENIREIIALLNHKPKILEFGCWKGELANIILSEFDIDSWNCIEICTAAIEKCSCKQQNFKYCTQTKFNWFIDDRDIDADIVIATHFIEHLSDNDFDLLIRYSKGIRFIYFESPLSEESRSWHNDFSTHKLTYGWKKVRDTMYSNGYKSLRKFKTAELFELDNA